MLADEEVVLKAELQLANISDNLGIDWIQLAIQLNFPPDEIISIQSDYKMPSEQAFSMLYEWIQRQPSKQSYGTELRKALKQINREDVLDGQDTTRVAAMEGGTSLGDDRPLAADYLDDSK